MLLVRQNLFVIIWIKAFSANICKKNDLYLQIWGILSPEKIGYKSQIHKFKKRLSANPQAVINADLVS